MPQDEAGLGEDDVIYIEPSTNIKNIWKKLFVRVPIFKEGFIKKTP